MPFLAKLRVAITRVAIKRADTAIFWSSVILSLASFVLVNLWIVLFVFHADLNKGVPDKQTGHPKQRLVSLQSGLLQPRADERDFRPLALRHSVD